ncbi:hypothetical protein Aph02nite_46450 [Actinoplanes philippinensis]|uniref:Uncharacterized protein n=1 Tax=Actinoplanes philippinensis TaxID=35752 RepID=A0A1I2I2R6_9ACTN|nr:hypothetical protein [Actinoplanes philippinensis]GIE78695.1 hypothetical protein Aph02nite_46450 [Actinoplanes philippinensis]SFF36542.1 hypothetical protein SAMN05421541_109239 [Actinoplanes philippinensis]
MNRFETCCHLDWWANPVTCLASVAVSLVVTTTESGWAAEGRLLAAGDEQREGFALLCDLDPVFTLRFGDGSEFAVTVLRGLGDDFTLTECVESEAREIDHTIDLR